MWRPLFNDYDWLTFIPSSIILNTKIWKESKYEQERILNSENLSKVDYNENKRW